jgi:putative hemin transport protein
MMRLPHLHGGCSYLFPVVEMVMEGSGPNDELVRNHNIDRVRQAIRANPWRMTSQLAREFGLPEVDVLRNFPADRTVELDVSLWEQLIRSLAALSSVRVLVSNEAATMEAVGRLGGFSTTGEFFNVQTETLDLHIRWQELYSAFAVEKPSHIDGRPTQSIQFFNQNGHAALKIFLSFGEEVPPDVSRFFRELRGTFRATPGA